METAITRMGPSVRGGTRPEGGPEGTVDALRGPTLLLLNESQGEMYILRDRPSAYPRFYTHVNITRTPGFTQRPTILSERQPAIPRGSLPAAPTLPAFFSQPVPAPALSPHPQPSSPLQQALPRPRRRPCYPGAQTSSHRPHPSAGVHLPSYPARTPSRTRLPSPPPSQQLQLLSVQVAARLYSFVEFHARRGSTGERGPGTGETPKRAPKPALYHEGARTRPRPGASPGQEDGHGPLHVRPG